MEGVGLDKKQVAFKGEYCAQGMDFWVCFFFTSSVPVAFGLGCGAVTQCQLAGDKCGEMRR